MREISENREALSLYSLTCLFHGKYTLGAMSNVNKPQKAFILQLVLALIVVQGKATFLNMSRYSSMSEKRFRRWHRRCI